MTSRKSIRSHIASATAALAVSAVFIGAAVAPAAVQGSAPVATQQVA